MIIKVGNKYKQRNGTVVHLTEENIGGHYYFRDSNGYSYSRVGTYWADGAISEYDLIEQVFDEETPTTTEDTHLSGILCIRDIHNDTIIKEIAYKGWIQKDNFSIVITKSDEILTIPNPTLPFYFEYRSTK